MSQIVSQAPSPAPETELAPNEQCPRCQKKLTDPNGMGWCSSCGYCRSLEEHQAPVSSEEQKRKAPSLGGLVEASVAIGGLPIWVWNTLLGILFIVGLSVFASRRLPPDSFQRALWTTQQIAFGFFVMIAGQVWALFQIASEDPMVTFKDAIFPFRLYGLIFKRMPKLSVSVYLGAWGMTLIACALIVIGGLGHWLTYLPGAKNNPNNKKGPQAIQRPR